MSTWCLTCFFCVCVSVIGGGNTATCFFCCNLCLILISHCCMDTVSASEVLTPCPVHLPRSCTDLPSPAGPTVAPIFQCFKAPDCLLKKDEWFMLGIPVLVYYLQNSYLGGLWIHLGLSFCGKRDYSSSPIKCVPSLLLYGIIKLQTKPKLVTYFLVSASQESL